MIFQYSDIMHILAVKWHVGEYGVRWEDGSGWITIVTPCMAAN